MTAEGANVLVLISILAGVSFPKVSRAYTAYQVRAARDAIVTIHAKARSTAMQRGKTTFLHFHGDTLEIRSANPVSGAMETVGVVESMGRRFGVTVLSSHDSLMFDGRGLGPNMRHLHQHGCAQRFAADLAAGEGHVMKNQSGFATTEAIVAVLMLSLGMMGLLATAAATTQLVAEGRQSTYASTLAADRFELLRSQDCASLSPGSEPVGRYTVSWSNESLAAGKAAKVTVDVTSPTPKGSRTDTFSTVLRCT